MKWLSFVLALVLPSFCFAQGLEAPHWFDGILAALKSSEGIVASVIVAVEFLARFIPTAKPVSLLIPVKYVLDSLAAVLVWSAELCQKLINALQNLK